ncbi:fungal-specific transcription factor domain-containing protein [Hypoxylon cercidicola]|nr:fungal-specific transcription factor domain-containing protein [Hypoxylon cercidicola]
MDRTHPPQRKACDLCYRRKIKCDGQKPRCTTCVIHKSDCTYNAASRKTPSRKQAAIQRQRRESDLQSRVETLEYQLGAVLEKVEKLEGKQDASSSTTPDRSDYAPGMADQAVGLPGLPSLQEVLPVVERYLATFNSVFPLFHPATLLQTVKSWYQNPRSRDPVAWAVINVVLAVVHHTNSPGDWPPIGNTAAYLNNVQSVLTEIIMRETDLVNVQVLLGLAILFWSAEDSGPALILIGTALRLAHSLGLHTKKSCKHYSPTLALQRNRVFWMAYILDRDISLQSKLAPVQLDSDIDLDLPPTEAEDDLAGFVFAADGHTKVNYFRARVELARIQGNVYDCVYSVSAQNLSSEDKAQNAARILRSLDDWSSRIPAGFHAATVSQAYYPELSRYFCILYSTRLSCRALLSFGSASDSFHYSEWMQRLEEYGGEVATGQDISHAPVPQEWQTLAEASREYIKLFETVISTDTFFMRLTFCAYTSSLISLIANNIFDAHHNAIEHDREIARKAMKNLGDMAKRSGSKVRDALKRLWSCADLISCQNTSPIPMSPRVSFLGRELQAGFVEPPEYQHLEDDVLMPYIDLSWAPLSDGFRVEE